jgi:hypothetical protein
MARPDPIQYAERLYAAIRAAHFSPISFLAFGNAVKEGVPMRHMPRIAAEPFMRVVGEMLELEEQAAEDDRLFTEAVVVEPPSAAEPAGADSVQERSATSVADTRLSEPAPRENPSESAGGTPNAAGTSGQPRRVRLPRG